MNILREKLRCLPMGAAAYFGGDSASATTSTSEVRDMRVVGGDGSTNLSANDSKITMTDHGAVSASFQFGTKALDANTANTSRLMTAGQNMFDGALSAVTESNARIASDLATAFTDAKAPDKSILMVGGLVVVGLAAVLLVKK